MDFIWIIWIYMDLYGFIWIKNSVEGIPISTSHYYPGWIYIYMDYMDYMDLYGFIWIKNSVEGIPISTSHYYPGWIYIYMDLYGLYGFIWNYVDQ